MGLFSTQIPLKVMVPLCRQMATSDNAGIPLLQTLKMMSTHTSHRRARQVFADMHHVINTGGTLSEAANVQSKYLSKYFIELLAAGEKGGKLDIMLRDLANYYEDRLRMRRDIVLALFYPVFILLPIAYFCGTFALRLVSRLNLGSGATFNFSDYLHDYMFFQLKMLLFFALIFGVVVVCSRIGIFPWIWGWFTTHLWPFGPVTRKLALSRFFRSMALLVGAGVEIRKCIENAAAITANPYIQKDLLQSIPYVSQGKTLVEAFSSSRTLTPVAREMLLVGEQSGELEVSLLKVSQYHHEEATHAIKRAVTVMGVVVMLIVACIIGYFIISFYSQLYSNILNF